MIDTIETLQDQHDDWEEDLLIHTILEMLAGPFNNDNYKNWEPNAAKKEILISLKALKGTKYEKKAQRINRHVTKLSSIKEIMLYLGDIILA